MKRAAWLANFVLLGAASAALAAEQKPVDALEKSLFNSEPVEEYTPPAFPSVSNAAVPPAPPTPSSQEEKQPVYNAAILQGLNKVTARVSTIQVTIGQEARFENLGITIYHCQKSKPEDRPENVALFQITDYKKETNSVVFSGWMFSSSPALSGLEHPVYDVSLLDCVVKKEEKSAPPASGNPPPPPR